MSGAHISGVALDVGGTLWPDIWQPSAADFQERAVRIGNALDVDDARAREMVSALEDAGALLVGRSAQDTSGLIRDHVQRLGLTLDESRALAVRRAMCLPAAGRWHLFPGAVELLATIRALGSRCILLSNGTWRGAECYQRDLDELGISRFVDAVITSVETGLRKPNPAIFELALAALGSAAPECVMVGNSEENDIAPALALGMRTMRIAIEEPRPASSRAHAIAGSLHEAAEILRSWAWAER